MLYGINLVMFTLTSVCIALYLLGRRSRIVTTRLNLRADEPEQLCGLAVRAPDSMLNRP